MQIIPLFSKKKWRCYWCRLRRGCVRGAQGYPNIFGVMNIERDLDWLCPGDRLRRGCVRGAQVVSRSEGVRLRRVEGGLGELAPRNREPMVLQRYSACMLKSKMNK
jgi:hypothetical protein